MKAHQFVHEMRTTSAVLGRNHGIHVQFEGDQAYTDGKVINLPALSLDRDLSNEQVRAMRGYVDHEAGHIRHSDLPRILDFYDKCQNNGKGSLQNIHNCLEDIWMEDRVISEYSGAEKNLKQTSELVKSSELKSIKEHGGPSAVFGDEITPDNACLGITTVGREGYGGDKLKEVLGILPERIKEHAQRWSDEARKCESTEDVITLAKSVYKQLEDDPELSESPEDFDPESGAEMEEGENSKEFGEGQGQGQGKGESPYDAKEGSPSLSEALTADAHDSVGGLGGSEGPLVGGYRVFSTEGDVEYRRGKKPRSSYASGTQAVVDSRDYQKYESVKASLRSNITTMKSKLRRALLARVQRDWEAGREVGRLDSKRLVAASMGSKTVFKQRIERDEEDTSVTFLVDLSGSMLGGKSAVARDCLVALSECLEGTDIEFDIVGFSNRGNPTHKGTGSGSYHRYERLDTVYFKEFDAPLRTAKGAIGNLPKAVGGNNTDYDFIVNAGNALLQRPTKRKVLFVLSDGHPACVSDASTSEHKRHMKEAIKDFERKGVECLGIGILTDSVTGIYPKSVEVSNIDELSSTAFRVLSQTLLGK